MIPVEELRIGSIVRGKVGFAKSDVCVVITELNGHKVTSASTSIKNVKISHSVKNITPIYLTEDVMKCTNLYNSEFPNRDFYHLWCGLNLVKDDDGDYFLGKWVEDANHEDGYFEAISYQVNTLHKLQNLVEVLDGDFLKIDLEKLNKVLK